MMDTEAFREFKTGLDAPARQLRHKSAADMRRAVDLDKNNPITVLLGVVLARSEENGASGRLRLAVRMKRIRRSSI